MFDEVLLLCLCMCVVHSDAQHNSTHGFSIVVECCDVLEHIHRLVVDKPTDRITSKTCRQDTKACLDYNLIKSFVKQTRLMLDPHNKLSEGGVTSTESALVFELQKEALAVTSVSIFAFMGRSLATDGSSSENTKWITYDVHKDKFFLQDTACEINRDVYTALLLASITLLVFFIGVQVQRDACAKDIADEGSDVKQKNNAETTSPGSKPETKSGSQALRNMMRV